jgi:hypothetical protein
MEKKTKGVIFQFHVCKSRQTAEEIITKAIEEKDTRLQLRFRSFTLTKSTEKKAQPSERERERDEERDLFYAKFFVLSSSYSPLLFALWQRRLNKFLLLFFASLSALALCKCC